MRFEVCHSLEDVAAEAWNALVPDHIPFLDYAFLRALERHNCVSEQFGWRPCHLLAFEGNQLIAAAPLYRKTNSYGEFVFDHGWADAYQRNGLAYFPKLLSAIPYTPAQGDRVLIHPSIAERAEDVIQQFFAEGRALAQRQGDSSVHWLFIPPEQREMFKSAGGMLRLGVQFHWENRGYTDFEDFLSALNSKRRKNIRRERRITREQAFDIRLLNGDQVTEMQWSVFSRFYAKTFHERYSLPTLNEGFFREVGRQLGDRVVLALAYLDERCVAGALMYRSDDTLYGRHWGCEAEYDSLHFELCYYQGIEYCIANGLQRFEPGAQGEHKIWRGFLPTYTYSAHAILHPGFEQAISDFLSRETPAILDYKQSLDESSPYRSS